MDLRNETKLWKVKTQMKKLFGKIKTRIYSVKEFQNDLNDQCSPENYYRY